MTERWEGNALTETVIELLRSARVARMASVTTRNEPRVVPVCFALLETPAPVLVSVLDEKPKRVGDQELARVRNLRHNPACSLVVDHYEEDWSRLSFVQVNGSARIIEPGDDLHAPALAALQAKYQQYRSMGLDLRPVIVVEIVTVTTWRGDGTSFGNDS